MCCGNRTSEGILLSFQHTHSSNVTQRLKTAAPRGIDSCDLFSSRNTNHLSFDFLTNHIRPGKGHCHFFNLIFCPDK